MRCSQGGVLAFIFRAIIESWQMKRGHRVVDLQRSACTVWHGKPMGCLRYFAYCIAAFKLG